MKLKKGIVCLLVQLALIGNAHAQASLKCTTEISTGTFTGKFTSYGVATEPNQNTTAWQDYGFVADNSTAAMCVNVANVAPIVRQYAYTAFVLGARVQIRNDPGVPSNRVNEIRVIGP